MHLNYLPLHFTSDVFKGGTISFEGDRRDLVAKESALSTKLRELRKQHAKSHIFHASGSTIACIPLTSTAPSIGQEKQFDIFTDFQVANALARFALFEFFSAAGNETVIAFRPVTLVIEKHNLASARKDVFGIFPEYTLDVRPLAPHEGHITSGVLMGFGIRHLFLKTAAELLAEGVSLKGLYVVQIRDDSDIVTPFQRRYLGKFEGACNGMAILSDSDVAEFPLDNCYLEGSRTNIETVGQCLLGSGYDAFSRNLLVLLR
ncbi:MAG TPA: hypothetical protein VFZ08_10600 [Terriglobia bacterium]|nr:hypothetical protein [Terriglobia bacterium]